MILAPPGGKPVVASWDRPLFYVTNPDGFPSQHLVNNTYAIVMGWALDYAATNSSFIVGLVNWFGPIEQSGYSTNGGLSWTIFPTAPPFGTSGAGSPISGCIAVSTPDNIVWVPSNKQAPYYTTNRGQSWTKLSLPGVPDDSTASGWGGLHWAYYLDRHIVAADRVTADTFYLYHYVHGLFRSTNKGATWTLVFTGEIAPSSGFNAKLRAVPGHAGHLFFTAGQQSGTNPADSPLRRSTDGGTSWSTVANVKEVYAFGFGKEAPGGSYPTIFIAGWVNGVYGLWRSDDEGQSLVNIGGFPLGSLDEVKAVEGDKNVYGTVYAGFSGSGYAYGVTTGQSPPSPPTSLTVQ